MEDKTFNSEFIIQHWVTMSDNDYNTMMVLFQSKQYNWTLFIGHLVIEKLLKACYVKKNNKHPVLTHNLLKLALNSGIEVSEDLQFQLDTITAFNMNARYDDEKLAFYKKCTPEFTTLWLNYIQNLQLWIKKQYLA
ncbi:MAG: HEPN domain-containing protein [Bacteroidia bacterium]|nr:HEPN domain-containing protein [Bacteroidia bacterium]